jgi:hypothetical protein
MKIENRSAYRRDYLPWCIVAEGRGLQNKGRLNRALTEGHKEKTNKNHVLIPSWTVISITISSKPYRVP